MHVGGVTALRWDLIGKGTEVKVPDINTSADSVFSSCCAVDRISDRLHTLRPLKITRSCIHAVAAASPARNQHQ